MVISEMNFAAMHKSTIFSWNENWAILFSC